MPRTRHCDCPLATHFSKHHSANDSFMVIQMSVVFFNQIFVEIYFKAFLGYVMMYMDVYFACCKRVNILRQPRSCYFIACYVIIWVM